MKKTILSAAAAVAVILLSASFAAAQTAAAKAPADPAQARAEVDKAIVVGPGHGGRELGDERLGIIQDFAEHFDALDDVKAKALLDRQMALEDKKLALQKKYKDEMLKVLPAKSVARFLQVDSRLNKLVELTVASEIPLVY